VIVLATGDDAFGAGFIAFMVVLALGVASYFLLRSMNRHLRNVPASFEPPAGVDADAANDPMTDRAADGEH
jgi:hypothetical protein